jgi:hypothetical protein
VYAASKVLMAGKKRETHPSADNTVSLARVTAARAAETSSTSRKIVRSEN